jgi:transcriptional regulator with XRE-family HTH domain
MTKVQDLMIINLKRARSRLGYSQMMLAEAAGISLGYIGDIEAGKKFPSAATMQKLIDALRMRPYELFLSDSDTEVPHHHEFLATVKEDLTRSLNDQVNMILDRHFSGS